MWILIVIISCLCSYFVYRLSKKETFTQTFDDVMNENCRSIKQPEWVIGSYDYDWSKRLIEDNADFTKCRTVPCDFSDCYKYTLSEGGTNGYYYEHEYIKKTRNDSDGKCEQNEQNCIDNGFEPLNLCETKFKYKHKFDANNRIWESKRFHYIRDSNKNCIYNPIDESVNCDDNCRDDWVDSYDSNCENTKSNCTNGNYIYGSYDVNGECEFAGNCDAHNINDCWQYSNVTINDVNYGYWSNNKYASYTNRDGSYLAYIDNPSIRLPDEPECEMVPETTDILACNPTINAQDTFVEPLAKSCWVENNSDKEWRWSKINYTPKFIDKICVHNEACLYDNPYCEEDEQADYSSDGLQKNCKLLCDSNQYSSNDTLGRRCFNLTECSVNHSTSNANYKEWTQWYTNDKTWYTTSDNICTQCLPNQVLSNIDIADLSMCSNCINPMIRNPYNSCSCPNPTLNTYGTNIAMYNDQTKNCEIQCANNYYTILGKSVAEYKGDDYEKCYEHINHHEYSNDNGSYISVPCDIGEENTGYYEHKTMSNACVKCDNALKYSDPKNGIGCSFCPVTSGKEIFYGFDVETAKSSDYAHMGCYEMCMNPNNINSPITDKKRYRNENNTNWSGDECGNIQCDYASSKWSNIDKDTGTYKKVNRNTATSATPSEWSADCDLDPLEANDLDYIDHISLSIDTGLNEYMCIQSTENNIQYMKIDDEKCTCKDDGYIFDDTKGECVLNEECPSGTKFVTDIGCLKYCESNQYLNYNLGEFECRNCPNDGLMNNNNNSFTYHDKPTEDERNYYLNLYGMNKCYKACPDNYIQKEGTFVQNNRYVNQSYDLSQCESNCDGIYKIKYGNLDYNGYNIDNTTIQQYIQQDLVATYGDEITCRNYIPDVGTNAFDENFGSIIIDANTSTSKIHECKLANKTYLKQSPDNTIVGCCEYQTSIIDNSDTNFTCKRAHTTYQSRVTGYDVTVYEPSIQNVDETHALPTYTDMASINFYTKSDNGNYSSITDVDFKNNNSNLYSCQNNTHVPKKNLKQGANDKCCPNNKNPYEDKCISCTENQITLSISTSLCASTTTLSPSINPHTLLFRDKKMFRTKSGPTRNMVIIDDETNISLDTYERVVVTIIAGSSSSFYKFGIHNDVNKFLAVDNDLLVINTIGTEFIFYTHGDANNMLFLYKTIENKFKVASVHNNKISFTEIISNHDDGNKYMKLNNQKLDRTVYFKISTVSEQKCPNVVPAVYNSMIIDEKVYDSIDNCKHTCKNSAVLSSYNSVRDQYNGCPNYMCEKWIVNNTQTAYSTYELSNVSISDTATCDRSQPTNMCGYARGELFANVCNTGFSCVNNECKQDGCDSNIYYKALDTYDAAYGDKNTGSTLTPRKVFKKETNADYYNNDNTCISSQCDINTSSGELCVSTNTEDMFALCGDHKNPVLVQGVYFCCENANDTVYEIGTGFGNIDYVCAPDGGINCTNNEEYYDRTIDVSSCIACQYNGNDFTGSSMYGNCCVNTAGNINYILYQNYCYKILNDNEFNDFINNRSYYYLLNDGLNVYPHNYYGLYKNNTNDDENVLFEITDEKKLRYKSKIDNNYHYLQINGDSLTVTTNIVQATPIIIFENTTSTQTSIDYLFGFKKSTDDMYVISSSGDNFTPIILENVQIRGSTKYICTVSANNVLVSIHNDVNESCVNNNIDSVYIKSGPTAYSMKAPTLSCDNYYIKCATVAYDGDTTYKTYTPTVMHTQCATNICSPCSDISDDQCIINDNHYVENTNYLAIANLLDVPDAD